MRSFILTLAVLAGSYAQAASMKQAFAEGKYQGRIRIYNNYLNFDDPATVDKYGTAFGGRIGYETAAEHLGGFSLGLGYYTANDLRTNKDSAAELAPFTPTVDVDILGEAFVRWSGWNTVATAGRQLIETPFANPADAFTIPITFTGYSIVNKSIPGLTINAHHMNRIKNRQAQDFADTGVFITGRYGATVTETDGTSILGLTYKWNDLTVQAWDYIYADMFTMIFTQADYIFAKMGDYQPFVSAHYGSESDTGDALLGAVDSSLIGVQIGVKAFDANLSLGFDSVSDGTFLTPYSFFTDSLYTNSMITGMGNVQAGAAWKLMLLYNFTQELWGKLSYSDFDFDNDTDFSEVDMDLRYKFTGDLAGFSIWFRLGMRTGDTPPAGFADLTEYRTQLQYDF